MLIDCDTCGNRGAGCSGCLVTALLDSDPADLGPAEHRAIEVFARAGFEEENEFSLVGFERGGGDDRAITQANAEGALARCRGRRGGGE